MTLSPKRRNRSIWYQGSGIRSVGRDGETHAFLDLSFSSNIEHDIISTRMCFQRHKFGQVAERGIQKK